jgi:translation elongation factor EF-G
MEQEGYLQEAIFGVIDVLMTAESAPLRNVRLKVVDAVVHPVDSSRMAFRRAGRDAGRKALEAVSRSASAPLAS